MGRYETQWAAQFYVAAELTRRGFLVAFTMGNARRTDLLVTSPTERTFTVQVKGAKTKAGWWAKEPQGSDTHFFILVYVAPRPNDSGGEHFPAPQFFIMTSQEVQGLISKEKEACRRERQKEMINEGLSWCDVSDHEDKWEKLPP